MTDVDLQRPDGNEQPSRGRRNGRFDHDDNPWSSFVGGMVLLAAGVVFWLDHLGRIEAGDYLRWWPLVLIAFGLANLPRRRWLGATVLILVGVAFLPEFDFLGHIRLSAIVGLSPLLVSAAGVTLILQALRPAGKDQPGSGAFRAVSFMGGSVRTIAPSQFNGGDAIAVMGACHLKILSTSASQDAVIDVLAFWGGIEIVVPRGWLVESRVLPILGGYVDRTMAPAIDGTPRLLIRGSAIMAGIEVRHPRDETA